MRDFIVAGNWKMNHDIVSGESLVLDLVENVGNISDVKTIVFPPYILLDRVHKLIENTYILLGAQEVSYNDNGAYTGEVSAEMIKSVGCHYSIIGHSERRQYHNETDEIVNKRINKILYTGLIPVVCIGETLAQREANQQQEIVKSQITKALDNLDNDQISKIILAYEPVWAIGTGKTATPNQAQEMHSYIRSLISEIASEEIAQNISILYGGSIKPVNAEEIFKQEDIDGGLVGGACLKSDSFTSLVEIAVKINQ